MKGFGIYIKNDLLEIKHVEHMGIAVWLYLWLIDKMTSISEEGYGLVLGGKPVKHEDVSKDLGISERTYSRWVNQLENQGYISIKRTPYGLIFSITKAKKDFKKRDQTHVAEPDPPKVAKRSAKSGVLNDKSGGSNKTKQLDKTKDITLFISLFNKKFSSNYRDTRGRIEKLSLRRKTYSLEEICLALENLSRSKFHQGQNDTGWKADPDFLLRSDEQVDKWLNKQQVDNPDGMSIVAQMGYRKA